jgi:hypothetical protein
LLAQQNKVEEYRKGRYVKPANAAGPAEESRNSLDIRKSMSLKEPDEKAIVID